LQWIPSQRIWPSWGHATFVSTFTAASGATKPHHGVPVMFLPGNRGSKGQGRSVASETLRRAARGVAKGRAAALHFYVVDFGEEWSALDAGVLGAQAAFAARAMAWLMEAHGTEQLVIVAHSMGAVCGLWRGARCGV
jgi:pimeloyl-ACP methyl ester carboxylesterase